ncbi:MAG: hypothetical protein IT250_11980 [Chitinophagaceae bacterium]|nr:hypothetical protein [Chitinophagaceae bacterium]
MRWCGISEPSDEFCTKDKTEILKVQHLLVTPYGKFIEKTTLEQSSNGLIVNYSRSLAYIALHFGSVPHQISAEEINAYLHSMMVHEKTKEKNSIENKNNDNEKE